jgi:hypothetical protein
VASPANGWYSGKLHDAASLPYDDIVTLDVPAGTGYRVYVYYRATPSDAWGIYGISSGAVNVTQG